MAQVAREVQATAPVDPMHPTVPSSYTEALDTVSIIDPLSLPRLICLLRSDSIGRNILGSRWIPSQASRRSDALTYDTSSPSILCPCVLLEPYAVYVCNILNKNEMVQSGISNVMYST